jgi:hypothetical protein
MEEIRRAAQKQSERTGLIFLFAEKCPDTLGADERNPTGILTWASNLIPPSRFASETVALEFVAVTVAQPSRIHTGFPDIGLHWLAEPFRRFQRAVPFYAE